LTDSLFLLLGSTFLKLSEVTTSLGKLEQRVELLEKTADSNYAKESQRGSSA